MEDMEKTEERRTEYFWYFNKLTEWLNKEPATTWGRLGYLLLCMVGLMVSGFIFLHTVITYSVSESILFFILGMVGLPCALLGIGAIFCLPYCQISMVTTTLAQFHYDRIAEKKDKYQRHQPTWWMIVFVIANVWVTAGLVTPFNTYIKMPNIPTAIHYAVTLSLAEIVLPFTIIILAILYVLLIEVAKDIIEWVKSGSE